MKKSQLLLIPALLYASCNYSPNEVKDCLDSLLPEEKEYFQKVAYLHYEKLKKWDQDIYVLVKGNDIRDGDQQTIDELIAEVSILINPLKITRTKGDSANLVFKLE